MYIDTDFKLLLAVTPGNHGANNTASTDAQEKAKHRRAQVRKAQIQHRQRKANYTKQLETDVVRLREMIEREENEGRKLRAENAGIRTQLSSLNSAVVADSMPEPALTLSMSLPEYTFTCEMSEDLTTPVYQITSRTGSASDNAGSICVGQGDAATQLSPEQTDLAINFILALEHICWDHFHLPHYDSEADPVGQEHGHALMASHIALQGAPSTVFTQLDQVQENIRMDQQARANAPVTADISWQSSGLTLDTLRDLAGKLNPPEKELAPIQAWFELLNLFGLDVVLDTRILDALKREFVGVVKCIHFGASIERGAFDSVVGRVMGDLREQIPIAACS